MTTEAKAELAPAKVNLALHITGRRADGYHLLDSLVVFADIADRIKVRRADTLSLRITGPFAVDVPRGDDNLVLRAARLLSKGQGAEIELEKNLPAASGVGGGSSDAAATLRALAKLWGVKLPPTEAVLSLGADMPVCLLARSARMRGIGEIIDLLPQPLPVNMLLVNPGVSVSTPQVFKQLKRLENPPLPIFPSFVSVQDVANYAALCRNDMEDAAIILEPVIANVLEALDHQEGCLLSRMSGSGATCFGLYASVDERDEAANRIKQAYPNWWVAS